LIGGRSPLLDLTRAQGKALEERLNANARRFRVYVGMRHWHPFIKDTVAQMVHDGIQRLVAVSMAPQYSPLSVGAYRRALETAQAELGASLETTIVTSWHDHPGLLQAFAERGQEVCQGLTLEEQAQLSVVFTAHSLPQRVLAEAIPIPTRLSAPLRVAGCGINDLEVAYQSRGRPRSLAGPDARWGVFARRNLGRRRFARARRVRLRSVEILTISTSGRRRLPREGLRLLHGPLSTLCRLCEALARG
jgi:ferrochelatase